MFTFGLLFTMMLCGIGGSWATMLIHRIPAGIALTYPPSTAPCCNTVIPARFNIPLIGWLAARGRCHACHTPIPVRYLAVELTSITLGAVWWVWAWSHTTTTATTWPGVPVDPFLLVLVPSTAVGVALAVIDWRTYRLPINLVWPWTGAVALLLVILSLVGDLHGDPLRDALVSAGLWLAFIGGIFLLGAIAGRPAMGLGDVRMAPVLGAIAGWQGVAAAGVGLAASLIIGAILGVAIAIKRKGGGAMPFGPALIAGTAVAVLAGPSLAAAYSSLTGL